MKKAVSGIQLALLLLSMLPLALNIQPTRAEAGIWIVDDDGPADFSTIQEAINAAAPDDTIIVKAGTYIENVVVDKDRLTIKSESGATSTTVQPVRSDLQVFHITSNFVTLHGFSIENASDNANVLLYTADFCNISDNIMTGASNGLWLLSSNNAIISKNEMSNNIEANIFLAESSDNVITNNEIDGQFGGQYITGIVILDGSYDNVITKNEVSNCKNALLANPSTSAVVYLNNFRNNEFAGMFSSISDVVFNSPQIMTYTYNGKTYNNYLGNYWSDYNGTDSDGDGIGDTPYMITPHMIDVNKQDNYPLMSTYAPSTLFSLTVNSAHGNPSPGIGSHSYSSGEELTVSVDSQIIEGNTIWTCTGWTGTGSVQSSGSGTTTTFTITEDSSITWNWKSELVKHTLIVSSTYDSFHIIPPIGEHAYNHGEEILCRAPETIQYDEIYICVGWIGTGSVEPTGFTASIIVTLTEDSTITWIYRLYSESDLPTEPIPEPTPEPTPEEPTPSPIVTYSTKWDPVKNSYSSENPASIWSVGGNCYGFSSTALLYFMHYTMGDNSYPYFPLQSPPASYTRDLDLPTNYVTTINNAFLPIMFRQMFDPNSGMSKLNWVIATLNEKQQLNSLLASLTDGIPVVLGLGDSSGPAHAVVAFGARMFSGGSYEIDIYDPNYPETSQIAIFDDNDDSFLYTVSGPYDRFVTLDTPYMISTSWRILWWDLLGTWWWWNDWLSLPVTGYSIIVSEKMVTVDSNGLRDYFTSQGNSGSFISSIPGSCGITEGNMQVYAIPEQLSFTVIDPGTDQSTVFVASISDESGQRIVNGFLLDATSTAGFLNYTMTPSDSGLLVNTFDSAFNASIVFFSVTKEALNIFQASDLPIDVMQTVNFTVTDWQLLNSTSQISVLLQVSSSNQPEEIITYNLPNGQHGLPKGSSEDIGGLLSENIFVISASLTIVVVCLIVTFIYLRRRKSKNRLSTQSCLFMECKL